MDNLPPNSSSWINALEDGLKERLNALDEKLQNMQSRQAEKLAIAPPSKKFAAFGFAYRIIIEMASGVVVGAAIGYGLDRLFGTLPLFLAIMSLAGFGAGVRLVLVTAREYQNRVMKEEEQNERA